MLCELKYVVDLSPTLNLEDSSDFDTPSYVLFFLERMCNMPIIKYEKDGKILYRVQVKARDSSGVQKSKTKFNIPTLNEAYEIEFELKTQLNAHKNRVAWMGWSQRVMDRYKTEFCASTHNNYSKILRKWVNPLWSKKFIDDLTPTDVHHLIYEHVQGVSSNTRKTILKIVKRVFNMAIEEGLLNRNPALAVKVRVGDVQQGVLNRSEIDLFLQEAKSLNHRFFYHWTLALLTGMRSGELYALRWSDVDFESGFISINKSWSKMNGEGPTKTAKNRVCPISSTCRTFLFELKLKMGESEYVLPRSREWAQGTIAIATKDFCKSLDITPIKFHDLRATFITQMLNNGVALSKVMAIVGHSSLKTTQGYLRLCGKDVEGATEELKINLPQAVHGGKILELRR